jgi:hypothetical protein
MSSYPVLREWLRDAKPASPWLPFINGSAQDPGFCNALETILERLERENPPGLASLRKRFGDDDEGNVFGLRTELVLGFHLAEAGVPFRFGGTGEPDFCCALAPDIWIEARMRGRDDLHLLQTDLRLALGSASVNVTLSMERRLVISEADRAATIERVLEALAAGTPTTPVSIHLPEVDATAGIEQSPFGSPSVFVGPVTADLAVHMSDIEREVGNVVREKTAQSTRNGWRAETLLVVDASRLGMAWLRPEEVWKGRLFALGPSWGSIPFLGVVVMFGGLTSTSIRAEGIFQDGLNSSIQGSLDHVLGAIGLHLDWSRSNPTVTN